MDSNLPVEDSSPINARPHSIDLSLELEHQLNSESLPNTPAHGQHSFKRQSLGPHVLASIITQLRFSLAEVTKERDEILRAFEEATHKQAFLQENLQIVTDRSTKLEEQLSVAQDKHKDDEEAINMLRTKVEESRSVYLYIHPLAHVHWRASQTRFNEASNGKSQNVTTHS
jgi:chromosome segregation ATPase